MHTSDDRTDPPIARDTGALLPVGATVLEIRTHGVSGTPASDILADHDGPIPADDLVDIPGLLDPGRRFVRRVDDARRPVPVAGRPDLNHFAWAYSWGRLTSGGLAKSLWAVLVPFALVNMAYAMIPNHPHRETSTAGDGACREDSADPVPTRLCRMLVHLLGLALTVLFTLQTAYVIVYLLAYRCVAASDGTCMEKVPLVGRLREHPLAISLIATLAVLILLVIGGVITKFTATDAEGTLREFVDPDDPKHGAHTTTDDAPAATPTSSDAGERSGLATEDFVDGNLAAPVLRALHGIAAPTAVIALLLAMAPADSATIIPMCLVLGVFAVVAGTVIAIDLHGQDRATVWLQDKPRSTTAIGAAGWLLCIGAHAAAIAAAIWLIPRTFDSTETADSFTPLSSSWSPIEVSVTAAAALAALLALALVLPARALRSATRTYPAPYRPWLHGFAPVVIGALAVLIGSGFGSGLAHAYTFLANKDIGDGGTPIPVRSSYVVIATMWGVFGLLVVATVLIGGLLLIVYSVTPVPAADALNPPPDNRLRHRLRTGLRYRIARLNQHIPMFLAWLLLLGLVSASLALWLNADLDAAETPSESWLAVVGTYLLLGLVVGLGLLIRQAIANPDGMGRSLGVLWDVASFWPREGHPVVPPSYAPTTVGDIVDVVTELRRRRGSEEISIVLCGHSQGSLIMYAAALQLNRLGRAENLSLLTYGSQLQWAYGRAFPAFLDFDTHQMLMRALGGRWINLIRFTDPVGGPVLSWKLDKRPEQTGVIASVLTEDGGRVVTEDAVSGTLTLGHERWLADPPLVADYDYHRGHSNYMRDAAWPVAIESLTTGRAQQVENHR